MGFLKQRGLRYAMREDDKFYLMNCSDLLGAFTSVMWARGW